MWWIKEHARGIGGLTLARGDMHVQLNQPWMVRAGTVECLWVPDRDLLSGPTRAQGPSSWVVCFFCQLAVWLIGFCSLLTVSDGQRCSIVVAQLRARLREHASSAQNVG